MRYATPERLLERLTDLRFLSIDFLNTFLLTYKVFTDGVTVLQALRRVYYDAEPPEAQTSYPTTSDVSLLVSSALRVPFPLQTIRQKRERVSAKTRPEFSTYSARTRHSAYVNIRSGLGSS